MDGEVYLGQVLCPGCDVWILPEERDDLDKDECPFCGGYIENTS